MTTFHLITGFLGSGKTTLLTHLLHDLAPKKRIAVIQNEFAPSGIDGKELKRNSSDFELLEINNGSVFCVCQLGSFERSMQKLLEAHQPELIFLEASGLADPISVVELLQADTLRHRLTLGNIISLVDAQNFFRGLSGLQRFKHQLMVADHVIINKTDLASGSLGSITDCVTALNPYASIRATSYGRVNWLSLLATNTNKHGKAAARYRGKESAGRPDELAACVLRTHDKIAKDKLLQFLQVLQKSCPRIKGYLNLEDGTVASVHSVYNQVELHELDNYQGPSELIAFGHKLNVSFLRQTFKEFI